MASVVGSVADTELSKKRMKEELRMNAKKTQKVVNVRSSSSANQEFMTVTMVVVNSTTAGGSVLARLIITGVCTDVKYGESGEVFNAIASSPPSIIATSKVENPAGPGAKEKKAMPMCVQFKGSVLSVGGAKATTFLKNDTVVQGPADIPAGTKVVLSGVHTGSFGKTDNPLDGFGSMNLSFHDIIVKDKCCDPTKAVERIAAAMDTPCFSKWQLFESLPALGDLNHIKSQNPPLGALIESKLNAYKKDLADGLRQKVQVHGASVLEVKCDGKEATHNMFPDHGESCVARAAMLDSMSSVVFSEMHLNGKNAFVPMVQRAVAPGDGTPPQLMALLDESRVFKAPFFVEPRIKIVEVNGNFVTLLFSMYVASNVPSVSLEESGSGPFVESSGVCGGANKSLMQLGSIFGTQLRDKSVMACDILPYAELCFVPKITKVEPGTDQFSFKDLPFSDGFVVDMPSTLSVAGVLVSDDWIKANLLKNGSLIEYKVGNAIEDQKLKLQKRDKVTMEVIYAPPPSLNLAVDKYTAITESTTIYDSLCEEVPSGKKMEFRVLFPGSVDEIKRVEEASDGDLSPAKSIEEGEKAVNAYLGAGDANVKRIKLMSEALVYAVLVDTAARTLGGAPPVDDDDAVSEA